MTSAVLNLGLENFAEMARFDVYFDQFYKIYIKKIL